MRRALVLLFACAAGPLFAHDVITTKVTWTREISRFAYKHCATCHRDGGSSFSLTEYSEARPWAKAIKEEVLERRMPPWGAVKGFGAFRDDNGLTQEDLELISDWVEGGAPEGDPALLPKPPDFTSAVAPAPETGTEVIIDGSVTLQHPLIAEAIRPKSLLEGSTMQVIAEFPDGHIEPLLWLYQYQPKFSHGYTFREPIHLPAGTKVIATPISGGILALVAAPSPRHAISALKPER